MIRFYDQGTWLLSSLGIALLVCGLTLVPQSSFGDEDPPLTPLCPSSSACNTGCLSPACFTAGCANVLGCNCSGAGAGCTACKCLLIAAAGACECGTPPP